ncbi:TolC family protein [Acidobacteria bacterium AH-259-O06]|nr:TolC family protein [Acidobacteria bacterium AH-259-O06]
MRTTFIFLFTFSFNQLLAQQEVSPPLGNSQQQEVSQPESYVERVRREGVVLELSLKDAIRLALANNLEIAIEEFNEDLNRERLIDTRGFYDPVFNFRFGWQSSETPNTSVLDAGRDILTRDFQNLTLNSSVQQNVPGGGSFTVGFDNNRSNTNSTFRFINPSFGSSFDASFRQPLWRGFLQTPTERQIKLYNLDTEITDSQFRQRVSEIIRQVEGQYWELVFAIENHETGRESMQLAIIQHENNRKRVEIGVSAPIEITSSRAEVATREQDMIQSEVQIINAQNALKRLLAPDPKASLWNLTLIPTDRPQMQQPQIGLDEAIDTALGRRPELEQMRLQMEKNEVDRGYLKKAGKPTVDLTFSVTSTGTSGQVFKVDRDQPLGVQTVLAPESVFFGKFSQAWNQVFGFDFFSYGVFVDVQIPLRNRSNGAQLAQVAITERQLMSRMKNVQQMIIVEVRNAFEGIATQKKRLEAAQMARRLSEEQLEGENKRFQAGLSTNFEVLRFQRDLAQSRVQELRALVDYQLALTDLRTAMYTIVDENDIVLARQR